MVFVESFPPVARADARVLVVGSMPGTASLAVSRYYAHPRNAFWPIMGTLCGFAASAPYDQRLARLTAAGVALWDVLAACERPGSLDAAIDRATARSNDFVAFFAAHPRLRAVACNGGAAHDLFRRRVLPRLVAAGFVTELVALPSTSPANAGRSLAQKREMWRRGLAPLLRAPVQLWHERPRSDPSP
ncbi:MAG: DNA-deoxyinosine glycosylase [Planctomycetes bacterium]|nr:DNA-deoxyinosine glycosylase [Planctomycetota bacterium]